MQGKTPLLLAVFIFFEYCFLSALGSEVCEEVSVGIAGKIADAMNALREEHKVQKITVTGVKDTTKAVATIIGTPHVSGTDEQANTKQGVANDETSITKAVKEWIDSEDNFDYGSKTLAGQDDKWPFARILWGKNTQAECTVCTGYTGIAANNNGLICKFGPKAPNLQVVDRDAIKENLPPKHKPEPEHELIHGKKGNPSHTEASKTTLPEFEKTVRTFTMISSIATIIIVVLGFVITLLVAIKIFVGK